ncbi:MAG TPA: hypothetical protein VH186_00875 [Chloroflexia bacterium]|nr:hypothetical protein [Chloroflexia bacterium]
MLQSALMHSLILSAEPLPSDSSVDFWSMLFRILLSLGILLVFVFACGLAWRTLPGLRAILPKPQRIDPQENRFKLVEEDDFEDVEQAEPVKLTDINLVEDQSEKSSTLSTFSNN